MPTVEPAGLEKGAVAAPRARTGRSHGADLDRNPDSEKIGHHHRDLSGGWLRAGTFGAMDGLVTNVSLIAGFAGTSAGHKTVLIAGLAGLVAGAFSMATGEYTSVKSQNEALEAEVDLERLELRRHPRAELVELAHMYEEKGLERGLALEVARQLHENPETALSVHAKEELGVDPDKLPSPWVAAGSSFVAFAVGAFIPLLPYLLGATSVVWTLILSAVALFAAGALVARFTSRPTWYSGLRQLLLGVLAAGATYLVGKLFGAGVT